MRDLDNYRFIVPFNNDAHDWLKKHFKDAWQTSDGSPFCNIDEGWLLEAKDYKTIPYDVEVDVYKLNERFENKEDFITQFWDGDIENDDFVLLQ